MDAHSRAYSDSSDQATCEYYCDGCSSAEYPLLTKESIGDSDDYAVPLFLPVMEFTEEPLPLPENLYSNALNLQERQARRALLPFRRELNQALKDFALLLRDQVARNGPNGHILSQYVAQERLEAFLRLTTVNLPASASLTPSGSDPLPEHETYLPADTLQKLLGLLAETQVPGAKLYPRNGLLMYPLVIIYWLMDSAVSLATPVLPHTRPVVNTRLIIGFLSLAATTEPDDTYKMADLHRTWSLSNPLATELPKLEMTECYKFRLVQLGRLAASEDHDLIDVAKLHQFFDLITLSGPVANPEYYSPVADRLVSRDPVVSLLGHLSSNDMVKYGHLQQLVQVLSECEEEDNPEYRAGHTVVSLRLIDIYVDQLRSSKR
ncbi:hypothetical protein IWQ60_002733 [Tieghemiomyces parasiticus]|uniref:Uncharacterized protein n=1 Tax=Tieghemiomyces parasiticus TaxID=78921 RepID=A0A9W8AC65_9FUNG|nr:hypothetical protein IWQ60_002733 [Tieghemiomyces parasiticus]